MAGYVCFGVYVPKDEYHSERSVVNLCPLSKTYNSVGIIQQLLHRMDERARDALTGADQDVKDTNGDKEGRVP